MDALEGLSNLIMIRYYLQSLGGENGLDFISEYDNAVDGITSKLVKSAAKEAGSQGLDIERALDSYIKEHDWTGCLGEAGSGNRERGLAIEGTIDAFPVDDSDDIFEEIYNSTH